MHQGWFWTSDPLLYLSSTGHHHAQFLCGTRVRTHNFVHTRQALYHWDRSGWFCRLVEVFLLDSRSVFIRFKVDFKCSLSMVMATQVQLRLYFTRSVWLLCGWKNVKKNVNNARAYYLPLCPSYSVTVASLPCFLMHPTPFFPVFHSYLDPSCCAPYPAAYCLIALPGPPSALLFTGEDILPTLTLSVPT